MQKGNNKRCIENILTKKKIRGIRIKERMRGRARIRLKNETRERLASREFR